MNEMHAEANKAFREFTDYFYGLKSEDVTVAELFKSIFLLAEYYDKRTTALSLDCADSKGHYSHTCVDVANKILDKKWLLKAIDFRSKMKER